MFSIRYKKRTAVKVSLRLLVVPCVIIINLLTRCTSPGEPVAGGTSIPNQIAGIIRNTDGTPVGGAKVKLIDVVSAGAMLPEVADSTETGNNGEYQFMNIEEGTYAIEAAYERSKVLFREDIAIGYEDTLDISGDLVSSGTITGAVAISDNMNGIVHIANSHYSSVPDAAGIFSITGLEPGEYIVLTIAHDATTGNAAVIRYDTVSVTSGIVSDVGTLKTVPSHDATGEFVIDDFEDGDNLTVQGNYWWMFDDRYDGGNSSIVPFNSDSMVQLEGGGTGNSAAHCTFEFGDDAQPRHIGIGFTFGDSYRDIPRVFDLSGLRKIRLRARGSGCDLSIDIRPELLNADIGINDLSTPVSTDWKEYIVDVASLTVSDPVVARNLLYGNRFIILATGDKHQSGELWIDDLIFEY